MLLELHEGLDASWLSLDLAEGLVQALVEFFHGLSENFGDDLLDLQNAGIGGLQSLLLKLLESEQEKGALMVCGDLADAVSLFLPLF